MSSQRESAGNRCASDQPELSTKYFCLIQELRHSTIYNNMLYSTHQLTTNQLTTTKTFKSNYQLDQHSSGGLVMTSSKKELKERENQQRLARAIETLDSITRNSDIQKSIRNMIREVLSALQDEKSGSLSVRAANAVSLLDNATQSPQMQSHIRTMLWQVVSTLESIRE